ncbi:phage baseplate assembly protein [Chitinivorax sp. PXF-14]|uniref:phage baseplate assembly protein n=1 Tax=Chitinivorax sp. PXF-14 TaxID=3230488 RepID=UPI0034654870
MATPSERGVALLIGGQVHDDWESYDVDSDLLVPADAWHVSLGLRDGELPPSVYAGAPVEVQVAGQRVMRGRVDEISHEISRAEHRLSLSGRDGAADLVDCSAPIFVKRQAALADIVAALTRELGVKKVRIDADKSRTREKINVEPGDTAWDALVHAAEANGLWPWFEPDGTLVVGGPDYSRPAVATLLLRRDGYGNNVLSLALRQSIADRYSHLTVLGQAHGTEQEEGRHDVKAVARDRQMQAIAYRPKIVVDHEADSVAVAQDRARKLIADARLKGLNLTARVPGHVIDAAGEAGDGQLWTPGQRLRVVSEAHDIDGIYFLIGRRFTGGRHEGAQTELRLVEDGTWVLDAHPHRRKHRRGKNGIDDGSDGLENGQ